jgi:hypothetical protein
MRRRGADASLRSVVGFHEWTACHEHQLGAALLDADPLSHQPTAYRIG